MKGPKGSRSRDGGALHCALSLLRMSTPTNRVRAVELNRRDARGGEPVNGETCTQRTTTHMRSHFRVHSRMYWLFL